ncbi:membrane-bound transcription factor site-2 protease-like isoform X2 [Gigantopelta aegis]|uniref:membrane-bound transcription factor site-2 protease-like isoform X2 n=1 Tax=Gigantopelta aegis TaxID=1735272 RepID=UPI001B88D097|nr:membrane-bound transcription factor site-2 protease-like isoform X2 [Gigantopelta aegis]
MLQTTWIALVLGFWSSLYLLDVFLKTKKSTSRSYIHILETSGVALSVCQLRWYTNSLNRTFLRVGQWQPHFLRMWFTVGVFFGLVAMLVSLFVLTLLVVNTLRRQPVEHQVLTPVMPGVNLPTSQISYYLLTLLVCGILHEVGHAVAAVREQVRVNGFGIFMFVMYPGAFVDLSTEHIQVVSPLRQLRIYCAGVWHNFVIVIIALMFLFSMPYLLVPFYSQGQGVCVSQVEEHSAVSGPRGLLAGETITRVSDCPVTNIDSWHTCILASMKEQSLGHCMPVPLIKDLDTSPKNFSSTVDFVDCCNVTSNTHLCFMYHSKKTGSTKYACLPARTTTDRPVCKLQSDCYMPNMEVACVYPAIDNQTKLLRIIHGRRPPLLFLGHPVDLFYSDI